jgi:hypothetical protein
LAEDQTLIARTSQLHRTLSFRLLMASSRLNQNTDSPWVVIRAVDSAFYEVFSTESVVLDKSSLRHSERFQIVITWHRDRSAGEAG